MKDQRTIAFYLGSLAKGGAERVTVNLAEYFLGRGYRVYIITPNQREEEYDISPEITRVLCDITGDEIHKSRIHNLRARILKLRSIFRECAPDVIVSMIGKNNFMAIQAAKPLGIPVAVSVRSAPEREYKSRAMRILVNPMFRRAAGVILQTADARAFFKKSVQKRAVILPNSLKPDFVKPLYEGERRKRIVTVGRLDDNKNQILLVEAFCRIAGEFPEYELYLYGDGPSRAKWEERVNAGEYASRIHFEGNRNHIENLIDRDRVFVLPSIMEGMPNALMEAMALGLTPISTDCPCGGPRELLGENENGLLVHSSADPDELADALRSVLADPELADRLSCKAYERACEFRPDRVNAMWEKYLLSLMKA